MLSSAFIFLMPLIAIVAGVKIYMYFKNHDPPHFHGRHDDEEEVFDLSGNTVRGGIDRKKSRQVSKWASDNEDYLKNKWDEFRS